MAESARTGELNCVFKEFMSMSEKNPVCRD